MPNEKISSLTVREYIAMLEALAEEHGNVLVMSMYDGGYYWRNMPPPEFNKAFTMIRVGGDS